MDEQVKAITKDIRVDTSKLVWSRFEKWMKLRGYKSLAEGIRAAMLEVIGLDPECQIVSNPKDGGKP